MRYFTFAGKDSRLYFTFINKLTRQYLPPVSVPSFNIPNRAGSVALKRNDIGVRTISIDVTLMASSHIDLRARTRALADFLIHTTDQELIFSDELGRKYFARFNTGSTDLEELAYMGEGTIEFTCFDPLAYSTVENTKLMSEDKIVISDYKNKVFGSEVENPNLFRYGQATTFFTPATMTANSTQGHIDGIKALDGSHSLYSTSTSGNIPQMIFSFNVIEILGRQLGTQIWRGKTALADKIAIAKEIITRIQYRWHGWGVSPQGNRITLARWNTDTDPDSWYGNWTYVASATTERPITSATPSNNIDETGFSHLLIYTDPSDGVTASSLRTDFIEYQLDVTEPFNEVTIINAGTFKIFPRLQIQPKATSSFIKWTNVTTGKSFIYNASWGTTDPLIVDMDSNRVYNGDTGINYMQNVSLESVFFPLEIGENVIRVENQNVDKTGVIGQGRIYWRERYL
jgi:predicted phage tail component-like protein